MAFYPDPQLKPNLTGGTNTSGFYPDPSQSATILGNSNGLLQDLISSTGNAAAGFAKSGIQTGMELGKLIAEAGSNLPGAAGEFFQGKLQSGEQAMQNPALQPQGTAQQIGAGVGDVAQFMAPGAGEEAITAKGASYIDKLPDLLGLTGKAASAVTGALKTALKSAIGAGSMATVAGAQTGGDTGQMKTAAEFGGLAGASTGVKAVKPFLPDILSFTSGIPSGAVAKAMQNPDSLKVGLDMPVTQIRDKALTAIGALDKDMKSTFQQGLSNLQKKNPFNVGAFNNAKGFFSTALKDAKSGIPSIFRDYGVSVQGNGTILDFEKLNSPIVKGAEQNNLQSALDTINRQKDFSPMGVERTAARLTALTKYGENNESSAIITRVKNAYSSAIEKAFPELGALRKQYGDTAQKISEIKNVIGKAGDSPKAIQSSVNRLTQIFNDDKDEYMKVVKSLGNMTGVDFEGLLASDKFKQILPSYIRGIGGGGAVSLGSAAVAHFLNPFYLLALPLFSPAAIGKGIEFGENLPAIGNTAAKGAAATAQTLSENANTPQDQASQQ